MSTFASHFWGEKNNGFDVLYQNMRFGLDSSKEFTDFLRESSILEETYVKLLLKLVARITTNYGSKGSFGPHWQVIRSFIERLAAVHQQLSGSWQELCRDIQKYTLEQQRIHKEVKDHEASTIETIQLIQQTVSNLQKAKENYHARCSEFEKLKRDNASSKDLERVDCKFKKANDEYRVLVDRYANVRNEFEAKMTEACKRFQEIEEAHLHQMKTFVGIYSQTWQKEHDNLGQVMEEFQKNCVDMTVDKLIETLVQSKTTGTEKPGPIELEEGDLMRLTPPLSTPDIDRRDKDRDTPVASSTPVGPATPTQQSAAKKDSTSAQRFPTLIDTAINVTDFLSKRRREKEKKKRSEKDSADRSLSETDAADKVCGVRVDSEGFSVKPENALDNSFDPDCWLSSSDSDSEVDERKNKINFEIKPFSPRDTCSGNVDHIRNSIKGFHISPSLRRRTPVKDVRQLSVGQVSKPSHDLWDLDIFNNTPALGRAGQSHSNQSPALPSERGVADSDRSSSLCTPNTPVCAVPLRVQWEEMPPVCDGRGIRISGEQMGGHFSFSPENTAVISSSSVHPLSGIHSNSGGHHHHHSPHGTRSLSATQTSAWQSSSPSDLWEAYSFSRIENTQSLNRMSSLGASSSSLFNPLNSKLSNGNTVVPIAVSLSETIHAYFAGEDERCKLRLVGEVVVSFPTGALSILRNNSQSSVVLSLRLSNTSSHENVLVNDSLITCTTENGVTNYGLYEFKMKALNEHLQRQFEQNSSASYFNIDILKYQICPRHQGANGAPLTLKSYWKYDSFRADFRLDYAYNSSASYLPYPPTLSNVSIQVPVMGDVTKMQCKPPGTWCAEKNRALWNVGNLSDVSEKGTQGCVRARFDLSSPPVGPHLAAVQFVCDGTTFSGIEVESVEKDYRISLVKKRFVSGKYISEAIES